MSRITESDIEQLAIELLEKQGWQYIYGPDIACDGSSPERESYSDVLLKGRLRNKVYEVNAGIPAEAIEQALKEIIRSDSTDLLSNNEKFHKLLTDGIEVEYRKDDVVRGDKVWIIDFDNPNNNEFLVCNQFTIIENNINKRPDIILFVNGLPLVVIELKNAADEHATVRKAFDQIRTYKESIPGLFRYNAFCVVSDGLESRAGTISSEWSRFMAWKTSDGQNEASPLSGQMETMIAGMLSKITVTDLIRHFVVFEKSGKTDPSTGITTIETVKKLAAYHQYHAVNKAIESTLTASGENGNRKGGVIWHTQGSGKSLSMVFFAGKLVLRLNNPTIVVITDRNDLDDQLFDTFAASTQLLRQTPIQADNREHLKELLKVASGGIVFTTIQKFSPENGNIYEQLSDRKNIVVIADEAHRTQYGFSAKTINETDESGNLIGSRLVYGFAKYMRDALPNATYLGFTGTPIESTDINTPAVFGNYVDIYDIARAVEDGATVRIYYESRLARINLDEEGKELIDELDKELESEDLDRTQQAKAKWTKLEAIIGSKTRLKNVAKDLVLHFEARQEIFDGKAMLVAMSRRIAVDLYTEIIRIRPDWHSEDPDKGAVKVVMTASSADGPELARHHTTKEQRRHLSDRMKDPEDPLKLVIVRDMWLTGFDVPCLHTMYIDKPMKGHNLMQAIARVNRVFRDKPGGLIVDYLGIAGDLKKALSFYSESGGKGDPALVQEKAVELMLEKLEIVSQMFDEQPEQEYDIAADPVIEYKNIGRFSYENYFAADTSQKLNLILAAEEHILGLEDGKNRFVREISALSKAFAIAVPHEQAMDVKEEVAFFQAVKARLVKFEFRGNGKSDEEIETSIRQVIDKAIVSDKVVDIFDAAGIKKPDISILSEEFLNEIKGLKHKNLALELLKRILNDEISSRAKRNLIQSKSLMEMLEQSIRKYQNKILTATEVIQELINLAKEVKKADERGEQLGLSVDELAFYDALADNESAKVIMGNDKLKDLAIVLVDRVRQNASIDWTIKESVRSKLKVIVKRTLRQFGYPPDQQLLATETVLKQAELFAEMWV